MTGRMKTIQEPVSLPGPLGYRMPAEWEPHQATWIAWPHNREDWPGKFAAIGWVYADIVRQLHHSECLRILVNDEPSERRVRQVLARVGADGQRIDFFRFATDRAWIRDYGPLFVKHSSGEVAITDWQ